VGTIRCTQKEFQAGVVVPLDEATKIVVVPDAAIATLLGRAFEEGRSFPLPRTQAALRSVFLLAQQLESPEAVVVGHASNGDDEAVELSRARATVLAAWLKGDHQPWLDAFGESVGDAKRWGGREDRLMIRNLGFSSPAKPSPGASTSTRTGREDPLVRLYQQSRELAVDGIAGPKTVTPTQRPRSRCSSSM
jgi:hypothetical protein